MEEGQVYHIPALAAETIDGLDIHPDGVYVDVTFGGGGHSRLIMSRLGPKGRLFGFDQDMDAYENRIDDERFTFVHGNFRYIGNFLRYYGVERVDGILADLGVSFHHFDDAARGFSFRYGEGMLDMRMNRDGGIPAHEVVAKYDEEQLATLFRLYGDLKNARRLASAIVKTRATTKIKTAADLTAVARPFVNPRHEKKELAQVFQALRMEVNHETDALSEFLVQTTQLLREGGRLAVISYHSVEDRMVKNYMLGELCRNYESAFSLSDAWIYLQTSRLPATYFGEVQEAISQVTAEELLHLAQKYFCKENLKEVVSGKKMS